MTRVPRVRFVEVYLFLLASCFIGLELVACVNPNTGTSVTVPNQGSGSNGGTSNGTPPAGTPPAYTGTVTTISWQPDGSGFIQFFTNDSGYIHQDGWSEWTWGNTVQQPMTTFETQVRKISGSATMGFGVIFCVQDESNFYVVYTDVTGCYSIGKVVAGSYTVIQPWTYADAGSAVLYQGYGYTNAILVTLTAANHEFAVSFNGTPTASFTDATFSGGAFGFVVGIATNESFPTQPVDVRFLQKQPAQ